MKKLRRSFYGTISKKQRLEEGEKNPRKRNAGKSMPLFVTRKMEAVGIHIISTHIQQISLEKYTTVGASGEETGCQGWEEIFLFLFCTV